MMKKNTPTAKELRHFGLLTGALFVVLFGLLFPWLADRSFPVWPWIIAVGLGVPAIVAPKILAPVYRIWISIGDVLGWINTRIILGILFFLVFLPVGFIMRLAGKDAMRRKYDSSIESYRVISPETNKKHFERPF